MELQYFEITAVIIAVTQQIKNSFPQVNGLTTLLVAMAIGAGAGYIGLEGIDMYHGILLGVTAVGTHTIASAIGKSKEVPSVPQNSVVSVVDRRVDNPQPESEVLPVPTN